MKKSIRLSILLLMLLVITSSKSLYGQTAGPTAPEYSSFEPIDITEMVNLVSGDFTYVLPIMEVPGPEGGYPIVLSYHAGIKPNVEASWVGLGWTLNTGAINRLVNGFPDDQWNTIRYVKDFWDGGERKSFHVGVGYAGASVGLDFSWDTYQGFGVGGSIGFGASLGDGPASIGTTVGVSPYGDPYASMGISVSSGEAGQEGLRSSVSLGVSTNFESVSAYAGASVSYSKKPGEKAAKTEQMHSISAMNMGVSIGSEGLKPRASAAGISISSVNNNAGKMSTSNSGFGLPIPVPWVPGLTIDIGWSKTRYWSCTNDYFSAYGVIHGNQDNYEERDNNYNSSFDALHIFNMDAEEGLDSDPAISHGGVLPATDIYSVTGQGISGSIEPYILENININERNRLKYDEEEKEYTHILTYLNTVEKKYGTVGTRNRSSSKRVFFRFNNDFSNTYNGEEIKNEKTFGLSRAELEYFPVNDDVIPLEYSTIKRFGEGTYHLPGSKAVKYYTNEEISTNYAYADGFYHHDLYEGLPEDNARLQFLAKGIKTMVDQSDDITFNFTDVSKQIGGFKVTNESGVTYHYSLPVYAFNEYTYTKYKEEDRDGDDVNTYRETKNYQPYAYTWLLTAITGPDYVDDYSYDRENGNFGPSKGDFGYWVKFNHGKWTDNYIWRAPANKAFEVDVDDEYRTFSHGSKQIYYLNSVETRSHVALFVKRYRSDGKGLARISEKDDANFMCFSPDFNAEDFYTPNVTAEGVSSLPASLLALDEIVLYTREQFNKLGTTVDNINESDNSDRYQLLVNFDNIDNNEEIFHNGKGIFDIADWNKIKAENFEALNNSLRTVKFNTDYSLMPGTINSINEFDAICYDPRNMNSTEGKLTLKSVTFYGEGQTKSLPSTLFSYNDYSTPYPEPTFDNNSIYQYSGDGEDIWGYYKSDYKNYKNSDNSNIPKMVTPKSALNIATWSLNKITTPLGANINIEYEADEYNKPDLYALESVPVKSISRVENASGQDKVKIVTKLFPFDLTNGLVGTTLKIHCAFKLKTQHERDQTGETPAPVLEQYANTYDIRVLSTIADANELNYTIVCEAIEIEGKSLLEEMFPLDETIDVEYENQFDETLEYTTDVEYTSTFESAELVLPDIEMFNIRKGGGVRVKSLSIETDNYIKTTQYEYTDLDGKCSGYTSYEPYSISANYTSQEFEKDKEYKNLAFGKMKNIYALNSFIPAPGVSYKNVIVSDKILHRNYNHEVDIPGYLYYTFNVFENNNEVMRIADTIKPEGSLGVKTRNVEFKDFTSRLGSLKKMEVFGADDIPLSTTENTYISDLNNFEDVLQDKYYNQGVIVRAAHQYRAVNNDEKNVHGLQFIETVVKEYPSFVVSTTTTNHKTGGISTTDNEAFDFFTGEPTKILTTDPYGLQLLSVSKPAYVIPQYAEMGPQIYDTYTYRRKNMLSQQAYNATYVVSNYNGPKDYVIDGVMKAEAAVWDKFPVTHVNSLQSMNEADNPWFKHKSYTFIGDDNVLPNKATGAYPYGSFTEFTAWDGSEPSLDWLKINELTKLNQHSKVLETMSSEGIFSCFLYDPENRNILAVAGNAKYDEVAVNNFEYYGWDQQLPNVEMLPSTMASSIENGYTGCAISVEDYVHSGQYSCMVQNDPGNNDMIIARKTPNVIVPEEDKAFKASLWLYCTDYEELEKIKFYAQTASGQILDAISPNRGKMARHWFLVEIEFIYSGTEDVIVGVKNESGDFVVIDDFRMAPLKSSVSTYVYHPTNGLLTYIFDANNFFTEFEYDDFGRLITTYTERLGKVHKIKVSENKIKYARENY